MESPSVSTCDFPLQQKKKPHTATERWKHELLALKKTYGETALKADDQFWLHFSPSQCFSASGKSMRIAMLTSSSAALSLALLQDHFVHFNFWISKSKLRNLYLVPFFGFLLIKYDRSVYFHFSLELNMWHILYDFTGRIRRQLKGVTSAWRTTVGFGE